MTLGDWYQEDRIDHPGSARRAEGHTEKQNPFHVILVATFEQLSNWTIDWARAKHFSLKRRRETLAPDDASRWLLLSTSLLL